MSALSRFVSRFRVPLAALAMFAGIEFAAANVDHGDYDPHRYESPVEECER